MAGGRVFSRARRGKYVFPPKNADCIVIDLDAVNDGREISLAGFDVAIIQLALHQV